MATKYLADLSTLVSLCKRRGFIFQSSEIYGGLNSCWDYGPLGVELSNRTTPEINRWTTFGNANSEWKLLQKEQTRRGMH